MEKADFEPLLGRTFEIKLDGEVLGTCRLEKIVDYKPSGLPNARKQPFGLDFSTEDQKPYPQYMVDARCEGIDEFKIGLIPAWQDEKGLVYHATFN